MQFKKNKIVKLESFLISKNYIELEKKLTKLKTIHNKIPDKFSFSSFVKIPNEEQGLLGFLEEVIGKVKTVEIKKFSHRDYTILHDDLKMEKGRKVYFFICANWKAEFGGNLVFVREKKDNFFVTPLGNSLVLIDKEKDTKEFVQYVNHLAGKNRFIIVEFNF